MAPAHDPPQTATAGVTRFPSLESMEQQVKMGMIDGLRSAMGQLDAVLAGR